MGVVIHWDGKDCWRKEFGGRVRNPEFHFGHIKSEMLIKYPSGGGGNWWYCAGGQK